MEDRYEVAFRRAIADPRSFWAEAASRIDWIRTWDEVLDDSRAPFVRWFPGAQVNTCFNALDRHVERGLGDRTALIYDSAMTGEVRSFSYRALRDAVARFAGVLAGLGVLKGERVLIYMPMVPEAVIAMLACARLGAVHSVVFGGFAAHELATRIDDARPRLLLTASCGLEPNRVVAYQPLYDAALALAKHKPDRVVVLQREQERAPLAPGRDVDWHDALAAATAHECVPVAATDPLYILYTSGTTGQPKGIVRDNGGHLVALRWSMQNVYGVMPGEVYWAASDIGWVVGHSYIVYAPLVHGCTTILYEGKPVGTPDAGAFFRVIAQHRVQTFFTAPTAIRAIKREDPEGVLAREHDTSSLRALFLAGERTDPPTLAWAEKLLGVPVIDHWWQTETGWPIAANCLGLHRYPVKPGSPTKPVPGWDIKALGEDGKERPRGETGALAIKLPLPPGALPTLWNADQRFVDTYLTELPGHYVTADAGYVDDEGYLYVMGRTDDVINVAGHRLSTGALEEVLAAHPDVAECAVIGAADELKGQVPVGILVTKHGVTRHESEIVKECIALVRERIGPVAFFKQAVVVPRLPKTRSGKVLRGTMHKIADGVPYTTPATIDYPIILEEIQTALRTIGYAQSPLALPSS
jgi:propionyl-CoA synthetase